MIDTEIDCAGGLERINVGLAAIERALGQEHPSLVKSYNRKAVALRRLDRRGEAVEAYHRALELSRKTYGDDHTATAATLNNLGNVLADLKRFDEAIAAHTEALTIAERVYGPEHPTVASYLNSLGIDDCDYDQCARAEPLHRRALKVAEQLPVGDQLQAFSLAELGRALLHQGRPAAALPILQRALTLREQLDTSPGERGVLRYHIAVALADTGGDMVAARAHASTALVELATARDDYQQEYRDTERWLASHPAPR